jgi:DNA-binding NarL/FixJ family response regulator
VVLVEDEQLVRRTIRGILESSGFAVLGESATARGGIEAAIREAPDICLVDIRLEEGNGFEVVRALTRRVPRTAVVMLSASDDGDDLIDAIRAGAVGYLLKGMDPERLAHALRGVVDGEAAIPRPLMAEVVDALQRHGRRRAVIGRNGGVELSPREWEVLDLLCDGHSTAEIGDRLSLSNVTVRRHVSKLTSRLGVDDRAEAVELVEGLR